MIRPAWRPTLLLLLALGAAADEPPACWLGLRLREGDPQVRGVFPASPALRAGVRAGDRLVTLGGRPAVTDPEYDAAHAALRPGQPAALVVERDGGRLELVITPVPRPANSYLPQLEEAIGPGPRRAALAAAQPACVRVGGASGVNLTPRGLVLTCAHNLFPQGVDVDDPRLEALMSLPGIPVEFPDGTVMRGHCKAVDRARDLALLELVSPRASLLFGEREAVAAARRLPFVRLAAQDPARGAWLACIGTPSERTAEHGEFHVSTGRALGQADGAGPARLVHDAWTFWGHSGAPLLDEGGRLVGVHASWDARRGTRRAVPVSAVREWLRERGVDLPD
ncbi:MAG: trypsin-like peptidase domain-containing protein [Planctomycetes bacterium]|nr:trypsin-like peptidase domain-containing protein [Planctomycetota bacterium]